MANTLPLISLAWLVILRRVSDFIWLTLGAILLGGLFVWLIGASNSVHLGASGVIFGYLGFLLSRGYFERSWFSSLISFVIAFMYGGLLWGVFPGERSISWEGHLSGLCSGIFVASILYSKKKRTR